MFEDLDKARALLGAADVFFSEDCKELNLNDVWGWAAADCEEVAEEELPALAELFFSYGWCGILYWVSKKRNWVESEFQDVNRFIQFVKQEEQIREEIPRSSIRAYTKRSYVIGTNLTDESNNGAKT